MVDPETLPLASRRAIICFGVLCLSMFINLLLAFLHARGVPMSSGVVIAVQAIVTSLALPAFASPYVTLRASAVLALGFIVFSTLVTNVLNPFNAKSIYDSILIPIYIGLGIYGSYVRPRWMSLLLGFVAFIVVIEAIAPSFYVSLFDPHGYLAATREWIAGRTTENAAADDGLYGGSYRSGGSQFSFTDHRVGGAFLEPLSLGYFAFLMSTYYAALYPGRLKSRLIGLAVCLALALASDSRIPTLLIMLSSSFLIFRVKLPSILIWITFPVVLLIALVIYMAQFSFLYGDTYYRMAITFDALRFVGFGELLVGMVPTERAGDSGVLYMLRAVGLLGLPIAVWFYSGAYTRRFGSNVSFFVMITVYLTTSLMFGGAALSIKTASLLGYLVGLAGRANADELPRLLKGREIAPPVAASA